jgi:hypothetical protein
MAIQDQLTIAIPVTADGTGGIDYTVPREGTIIGVRVYSTATNAGATATLSRRVAGAIVFNAITGAVAATPVNTLTPAPTLTLAQTACDRGDVLRVVTNDAADRCVVYIDFLPPGVA